MKRRVIICACLVVLIISFFGLGVYFYKYKNREDKPKLEVDNTLFVLKEDLTIDFLSEVKVSDFISQINGEILDDFVINTNELGEVLVEFEYENNGKSYEGNFTINVVDKVPPVIWLSNSYTINVGSDVNLAKKIMCGDNYDSKPNCEVIGEYDYNKVGVYPLTYKAKDSSGNVSEINFNLNVVEPSSNNNTKNTKTLFSDVVSKYKNENTEIGLDVSEWQDYPNYDKLKEAGVEFVFIRVGGSKLSNGEYFLDKSFVHNITEANRVGIKAGVYFYSYANNKERALKDAEWIYNQIKDYNVPLGVAYDWENWSFYNDFQLSFYELTDMANSHLNFFRDKGYDGYLYSSKSYLEEIWLKSDFPVWMAHYTKNLDKSSYSGEYRYWQLCSDGRIDGIDGAVDINIGFKN